MTTTPTPGGSGIKLTAEQALAWYEAGWVSEAEYEQMLSSEPAGGGEHTGINGLCLTCGASWQCEHKAAATGAGAD